MVTLVKWIVFECFQNSPNIWDPSLRFKKENTIFSQITEKGSNIVISLSFLFRSTCSCTSACHIPKFRSLARRKNVISGGKSKRYLKRYQEIKIKSVCQTAEGWTNPATPSQTQQAATPTGRCGKPHWQRSRVTNPDRLGCSFTHSVPCQKARLAIYARETFFSSFFSIRDE